MARPWTSLDVPRMVELYAAGGTVDTIAAEMGVDKVTISRRLRAAGVTMRAPGVPRKPVSDEEILRLRGLGVTWREIGEQVGMTTSGAQARGRRAGWVAPPPTPKPTRVEGRRGQAPRVDDAELLRLRGEGLLWREVAERVGMTKSGVTARWREMRLGGQVDRVTGLICSGRGARGRCRHRPEPGRQRRATTRNGSGRMGGRSDGKHRVKYRVR